ncbi:MAG: efflux RND transporter periplasmic adaptor subunit [Pseudomonadota bacterium]
MNPIVNALTKISIPAGILGFFLVVAALIDANPPEADRGRAGGSEALIVEALRLEPRDYQVVLDSYGTVQPRTQAALVSQVAGQITRVSPSFREGGFFTTGDVLVEIDARDYAADVDIAEATLMSARQTLAEAEARSQQALEDWARLGNTDPAPPLVQREPQLRAARAQVDSAEAQLRKAELSLERTRIRAPFDGRVLTQSVDVGQVVNALATLGSVYATDDVEIRLPLRNRDLAFVDLPDATTELSGQGAAVTLISELGGPHRWSGALVRTEGAIDTDARQLHVVAKVQDPFGRDGVSGAPMKIGEYVTATIGGRTVPDALVIPNANIYQGTFVFVVTDGVLDRRRIDIAWQNDSESLVASGVSAGEQIVTTQLGQVATGTRVTVRGADMSGTQDTSAAAGAHAGGVAAE